MTERDLDLGGRAVLVTGGTGFIGGRLVERLVLEGKARVRVLVRNYGRACQLGRLPVELVRGDIVEPADVRRAVIGCDTVFHCAYGNTGSAELQRQVNVQGTQHILEAALQQGIRRVVHVSTVAVYGPGVDGDLDETAPRRHSGHVYADSKLDAETIALQYARRGLPVCVVQPTVVYGPFAPVWTIEILRQLRTGRVILVDGGTGLANVVYVDDVVSALLRAAVTEAAVGETFLISGEPVPWREFFGRYERMLGIQATVTMSTADTLAYSRRQLARRGIGYEVFRALREDVRLRERLTATPAGRGGIELARRLLRRRALPAAGDAAGTETVGRPATARDERPIFPLDPTFMPLWTAKTRVRIDKATRVLGYRPAFDFATGMSLTEQWAEWANLLGRAQ
jgi:nucleoside-diphosphate-sugar epimerase